MNETSSKNEITSGIIWKQLLLFFFPILLGSFFQQLYNTIDAVIVGRFVGKNALAAVAGSSGMVINLLVNFFTGLTAGASVIVSQFFGSGDRKKVDDSIHTIYAFSIIGSVIMTLIGITAAPALLRLMNTPEELMSDSILYLRIYFAGIFFVFIYNTGAGLLRALGDSRRPLYCLMICCVINIVLDLLLIVGLGLGVAGAAIATLLSQGISAVIVTVFLMRQKDLCDFSLKEIRIHPKLLKSELLLGLPGGFQYAMYSISNMIIQSALNKFGTDTVAAWAAYGKLDAIVWMVSGAFGIAITTFVGQNYGARKLERARQGVKQALIMSISMTIFLCALLLIFRDQLLTLFTNDSLVIQYGSRFIGMIAPFYFCTCFNQTFAGAMRGIGKAKVPMIVMLSSFVVFRQIFLYVGTKLGGGFVLVSLAYPMGWVVCSIAMYVCYKRSALCHPEKAQFAAADTAKDENVEDAIETADEGIE